MNAKKPWIVTALMLIVALLLVQCGGAAAPAASTSATAGAGASSGGSAATGDQVQLRVVWWGSQDRHDRTIKVIQLFEQQHPNIKITYEFAGFDPYWTKLTTQAAGGALPDVMQQDYAKIADWVSRGLMLPLDDYVAKGTINLKGVDDKQLVGGRINGKLYAVNLGTNAITTLYDPALLQKAGVQPPAQTWTWDDQEQLANQIHAKLGIYGASEGLYNSAFFGLWLRDHGASLYNKDGTGLGYTDDKLFSDYFNMLLRMQKSGAIPTREFDASRGSVSIEDQLITSQKSAMATLWSNQVVAVAKAANRPLQMTLMPGVASGQPGLFLKPSQFFSISAKSQHPTEAAMFIDFFTNSVEANKILLAERGVPIAPAVREALTPLLQPAQKQMFDYVSLVEKNSSPIDPPDPPGSVQVINTAYTPLVDQILYGKVTPEDGAKQFREQATAILAKQK